MTQEFIHEYKGYGVHPSECIVRMYTDDGDTFICFVDLDKGTSVTNATEQLAAEIVNKFRLKPEDCRFFETYKQYGYSTLDEIEYKWWPDLAHWVAREPKWHQVIDENLINVFTE